MAKKKVTTRLKTFDVLVVADVPAFKHFQVKAASQLDAESKVRHELNEKEWDSDQWQQPGWESEWENAVHLRVQPQ